MNSNCAALKKLFGNSARVDDSKFIALARASMSVDVKTEPKDAMKSFKSNLFAEISENCH